MRHFSNTARESSEQHVELGVSRCNRYYHDFMVYFRWFEQFDPFDTSDNRLGSLYSGLAAKDGDGINCDDAELVGNAIQETLNNLSYTESTVSTNQKIKTLIVLTKGVKEQLRTFLQKENEDTLTTVSVSRCTGVKLPELTIKKFNGDLVNWKNFLESFEAAVDIKESLSNVENFTYLKGYLSESAQQSIEWFSLTNNNYTQAMILLKERYGNPQLIVSSHMNALIKLERINGSNVKDLRQLYDKSKATHVL